MKLEYTGLKADGETAFIEESGIRWFPGDVHNVPDGVAKKMLGHPSMWKSSEADVTMAAAKVFSEVVSINPGVPAWAKAGIEAGLSDEQLETIAQLGGPSTPAGAKYWGESTDAPIPAEFSPIPVIDDPKSVIRLDDGTVRILDGMTKEKLHDLAAELRVKVHPMTGIAKLTEALMAAYPLKKQ
jgi:hypothetical protein